MNQEKKKKLKSIETIKLQKLLKNYQITDIKSFEKYLTEVWEDLARRSREPAKGIEKLTFSAYYDLPGIILERLFSVFDTNQNNYLDQKEFINGMKILFNQEESFDTISEFIFKFYDFDHNGLINKEDVRVVLSYVPLQNKSNNTNLEEVKESIKEKFEDRVESQEQLFQIINKAFGNCDNEMALKKFIDVIENVNSDIFILILMFLLEKRPFNNEAVKLYINSNIDVNKKANEDDENFDDNEINKNKEPPLNIKKKIASPSVDSRFLSPSVMKRTMSLHQKKKLNKNMLNIVNFYY